MNNVATTGIKRETCCCYSTSVPCLWRWNVCRRHPAHVNSPVRWSKAIKLICLAKQSRYKEPRPKHRRWCSYVTCVNYICKLCWGRKKKHTHKHTKQSKGFVSCLGRFVLHTHDSESRSSAFLRDVQNLHVLSYFLQCWRVSLVKCVYNTSVTPM